MDSFERKITEKLNKGDTETLEYLYHLYAVILVKYAFRFVKDEEIARDMVQEVFYNLWKKSGKLTINQSLEAFLYVSVKYQCLNFLKRENRKKQFPGIEQKIREMELQYYENQTENYVYLEELQDQLYKAIIALPEKQQRVFRMSRFEGKKNREIARELEISKKAVEKHISKALKTIRKSLGYEG